MEEISVLNLFLDAGLVVKLVMIILFVASILSWIVIVERYKFLKNIKSQNDVFLKKFWSGSDLDELFNEIRSSKSFGAINLFKNSYDEFINLTTKEDLTELDLESINRSMRVSIASDDEEMSKHLSFLANVGSVSPYIGLLGTVWGIMTSFQGLSDATQATINAVAPGISEALVATGMGLFAAIPALVSYNWCLNKINTFSNEYYNFSEELIIIFGKEINESEAFK